MASRMLAATYYFVWPSMLVAGFASQLKLPLLLLRLLSFIVWRTQPHNIAMWPRGRTSPAARTRAAPGRTSPAARTWAAPHHHHMRASIYTQSCTRPSTTRSSGPCRRLACELPCLRSMPCLVFLARELDIGLCCKTKGNETNAPQQNEYDSFVCHVQSQLHDVHSKS